MLTRRAFSKYMLASGTAMLAAGDIGATASQTPGAEQRSNPDCDLLIKGGTVIDPARHIHSQMDVAVKNGKILEISGAIPEIRATKVLSAKGQIVTPGLIDLHVHCFDGFGGVNADHYCLSRGVTTVVDCGSAGYSMIEGFIRYIIRASSTRIMVLVDIGALGTVIGTKDTMMNLDWVNPSLAAKAANENKPDVVGVKVRLQKTIQGSQDLECLKRALAAAEAAHLPLMVHISDPYSPLPEILKLMRKGDVYTHLYNSHSHGILDASGKILPEVLEAKERGIIFDSAHGRSHFSFSTAEKALKQGFFPDTISTDLSEGNVNGPVYDLPTTLSKFMALGMDLDAVVERVTVKPAKVFDYGAQLGTLQPGSEADIGIFELREGTFEFVDSDRETRLGHERLVNRATVRRGELFINQS
ncbi:MAG: amidohydrolase/deacetylase family metallohydrolase [Candidatus Sulfotelmatobacter sp.]|jgi:dihydroorotase